MKIWEVVKSLEEQNGRDLSELKEAKATMIINYGKTGRAIKGIVDSKMTLTTMIVLVGEYYLKI